MATRVSCVDRFYNVFLEPFDQGAYNIQTALTGERIANITIENMDGPLINESISLAGRVTAFVLGTLLLVPIINALVLVLLKCTCANSNYLYPPISQPISQDGLTVNSLMIGATPNREQEFRALEAIARDVNPPLLIGELLTQFDDICNRLGIVDANAILYQDPGHLGGINVTRASARASLQANYIQFIEQNIARQDNSYYHSNAIETELFLKGIIFELRNSTIDLQRKRTAIIDLCSASQHCEPRRHEEAFKVLRALSSVMEQPSESDSTEQRLRKMEQQLSEIVLRYIQEVKDTLFRNYYSLSNEPVQTLNYIRQQVGAELGLDSSDVRLSDIHMCITDARSRHNPVHKHTTALEFRSVFHRIYTPRTILFQMKTFLNIRMTGDASFEQAVSEFIDTEIRKIFRAEHPGVEGEAFNELPEIALLPLPYTETSGPRGRYQLTDAGVKFLMVYFGILNTDLPNEHIVRT